MSEDSTETLASRRQFLKTTAVSGLITAATGATSRGDTPATPHSLPPDTPSHLPAGAPQPPCLLTPADEFYNVSRGNPKPYKLTGDARVNARLTPDTWRLEVVADPFVNDVVKEPATIARPLTLADGTAIDLPALQAMGKTLGVRYLKAMQCLNIASPLGQGLWEGVPLRDVLRLCGPMRNVRRIYYWGFHNNDPKQVFQSSLSYTQAMETPPGELPAFIAYQLNGEPISLERGGPVRMVIPWAHGFKSIKWLQRIMLTNDFKANDTYANQNNDPESHLKTAAYINKGPDVYPVGQPIYMTGMAMSGLSGLQRVESWLHRQQPGEQPVVENDDRWRAATWSPCRLEPPPEDWQSILPKGVAPGDLLGFDPKTGRPLTWPMRYTMVSWMVALNDLKPGKYEFRARAVDLNGFAQPEPRSMLKAGKNAVEVVRFTVK